MIAFTSEDFIEKRSWKLSFWLGKLYGRLETEFLAGKVFWEAGN
jgi:hypothetical protein